MEKSTPPGGVAGREPAMTGVPAPGYWSTGLCDCFSDINSCCLVWWCPCVAFGRISEIVDKGASSCCFNGSLYLLLSSLGALTSTMGAPLGLQWIYSCTYRGKLKHDLNMPPSCGEEFCAHLCCQPCALCQEYRELQNLGYDLSLGWEGNMEKKRYENATPHFQVPTPVYHGMTR